MFLLLSSVVSIWRDLGNSQLSLATAWSVTNTFILGAFMVVALKESWRNKHPRRVRGRRSVGQPPRRRVASRSTTVIVPPALENTLGVRLDADNAPNEHAQRTRNPENRNRTRKDRPRARRRSSRREPRGQRGSSEMTWINRLRLFAGLLGVILVVAVLTLIFNQRQTQTASLDRHRRRRHLRRRGRLRRHRHQAVRQGRRRGGEGRQALHHPERRRSSRTSPTVSRWPAPTRTTSIPRPAR